MNWELEPGEKIEEFVAAMLLLDHPRGNRITPARGDRGVDIRVPTPDGYDIYQVKRYNRPLTSAQVRDVEKSWKTFVSQTLPYLPVRSWTLAMPWDPTNTRLEWLQRLTAGTGLDIHWMGRASLDGMAARRPSLVDYYFGDGGQQVKRLMADVLRGGRDLPDGEAGQDLLEAVVDRYAALTAALNDVDPFYDYEFAIRVGRVAELSWEDTVREGTGAAFVHYRQLTDDRYLVMRLLALSAESQWLRPITAEVTLEAAAGSREQQALEEFIAYGVPFEGISGTVTRLSGPAGPSPAADAGQLAFIVVAEPDPERPDLEVRLLGRDGTVLHTLDLVEVRASRGLEGPGFWLSGTDPSGIAQFQFLLNGADRREVFRLDVSSPSGKTPAEVLPAMRLLADLAPDTALVLAVREGRAFSPVWQPEPDAVQAWAAQQVLLLEALKEIQKHSLRRVVVPPLETSPAQGLAELLLLGRLLRGETVEVTWTEVETRIGDGAALPAQEFSFVDVGLLQARLGDRVIDLGMKRQVFYRAARVADPAEAASAQVGDTVRLIPGTSNQAFITAISAAPEAPTAIADSE
ncbi:hypothetical protein [Microbispora sp. NBRC 16548]|uniref:hypothetical protein n=1 Tax=Microbispora sp. NBRC 16548 TaxID=3030994 RepID=UPI0025544BF1|nr:hypothetical protein [Microbispora sp. NBRC 16548]